MTVTVTIIPETKSTPETLFINFIQREYVEIKDCQHSYEEHCKYTSIVLDGEITTRVYFRNYPQAVTWCKQYIRESDYIVKVDDNTGATNSQENWYANVIKTRAQLLAEANPDKYTVCKYCGNLFKSAPRKEFCNHQHNTNYHNNLRNKKKKEQQTIDK